MIPIVSRDRNPIFPDVVYKDKLSSLEQQYNIKLSSYRMLLHDIEKAKKQSKNIIDIQNKIDKLKKVELELEKRINSLNNIIEDLLIEKEELINDIIYNDDDIIKPTYHTSELVLNPIDYD